jgi:hypothetical protein
MDLDDFRAAADELRSNDTPTPKLAVISEGEMCAFVARDEEHLARIASRERALYELLRLLDNIDTLDDACDADGDFRELALHQARAWSRVVGSETRDRLYAEHHAEDAPYIGMPDGPVVLP